jgi:transcriptional antiterminator NusG
VEDQQAPTVKGEEELSPELNDEAPQVQDLELEAPPEADLESDTETEDSAAEAEESAAEEDQVSEAEEPVAEAEELADDEEEVADIEEAAEEGEEPVAEAEEPVEEAEESPDDEEEVAEAEEPAEEVEESADEEEEVAEAEEPEPLADLSSAANGSDGKGAAQVDELATEVEPEAPEQIVAEPDDGREWYVVHCYSGYENKVRHNLEQRIETMDMKSKIFDVVVPTEEEMEVKDGKRRTVERRVFPGYILVQMIMDEDSWYVVRNTPGVTGFVGMGNDPTPLRPEEVSQIVKRMEADAPRIKVTYDVGQKVRIIDGPFNDFIGTVDDIDMDKAKVRVMVSFFGRETPVELDFLQVEKA